MLEYAVVSLNYLDEQAQLKGRLLHHKAMSNNFGCSLEPAGWHFLMRDDGI